jgi:Putative Actinobacterial Holin-X, holin superfamily III
VESDSTARRSIASLVSGIISDLGDLVAVELRIAKAEFEEELGKARVTAITLGIAAGLIGAGALLLLEMLVQLVHAYTELPLWGCYGIVGFCSAGGGGLLLRSRAH